ncbi:MAG TPA: homoserine O-acetyltransferase [Candidatus Omnitrophota bacterium]|nr:homoserine O-acetyltransferase [Candidatus Omnitrophota bacterium]
MTAKTLGKIETKYFTFAQPSHEFKLESGRTFGPITVAYESYGQLNADKSNTILVMHAFSGNAHVAGPVSEEQDPPWWDFMVGPGKALDTEKYFVLCANVIGGCKGTTGPSSMNPKTGKPYALDFPLITIGDMVRVQKTLIDHLGIKKLHGVIGGSMGGMLALQWVALYPDAVECVIPIAATLKHSPQQIAFNEVGRQAIMADPAWNYGNYYGGALPEKGLAVARMVGHITYMSNDSMEKKFSRRLKDDHSGFKFSADFEVEGYLQHRGMSFVKRFDANSYLYITKAMDYFDLSDAKWIPPQGLPNVRFLVIAFKSDWLYPSVQSQEMVRQLKMRQIDATYCEIDASYGHDSFLIESESEKQSHLIKHFLAKRK